MERSSLSPILAREISMVCHEAAPGKPKPSIGASWVVWALVADTAMGIRFVPVLGSLGTSFAVGSLSRRFHGNDAARWTVLLLAVQPATFVGSAFGFPDAPLLLFWSLSMVFLVKALEAGRGIWWLAVGAGWGAALLSKYTACFFAASVLLYLAVAPRHRA